MPAEDIGTQSASDDVSKMWYIVTVWQRRGYQDVSLAFLRKSDRSRESVLYLFLLKRSYIAASPGAGIERSTPSAGLIFAVIAKR